MVHSGMSSHVTQTSLAMNGSICLPDATASDVRHGFWKVRRLPRGGEGEGKGGGGKAQKSSTTEAL